MVLIYLRGYLVPGTPTLTKRYLPNRVLRWFGKAPVQTGKLTKGAQMLQNAGILVPCENQDDLCLEEGFEADWHQEIDDLDIDTLRNRLKSFLSTDAITIKDTEDATYVLVDNEPMMLRNSRQALEADIAILPVLRNRCSKWEQLSITQGGNVMSALRVFLEYCPACGTKLDLSRDMVESCCQSQEVYSISCEKCGIQMAEVPDNS